VKEVTRSSLQKIPKIPPECAPDGPIVDYFKADVVALRPVCPIVDLPTIVQAPGTVA
jgi:hypothetical protein